jgi:hypothetical protein
VLGLEEIDGVLREEAAVPFAALILFICHLVMILDDLSVTLCGASSAKKSATSPPGMRLSLILRFLGESKGLKSM